MWILSANAHSSPCQGHNFLWIRQRLHLLILDLKKRAVQFEREATQFLLVYHFKEILLAIVWLYLLFMGKPAKGKEVLRVLRMDIKIALEIL